MKNENLLPLPVEIYFTSSYIINMDHIPFRLVHGDASVDCVGVGEPSGVARSLTALHVPTQVRPE